MRWGRLQFVGLVLCAAVALSAGIAAAGASGSSHVTVPRGKSAAVGAGWRVKVELAAPALWILDGHLFQVDPGDTQYLVRVTVQWSGGGKGDVRQLLRRMWLHGAHGVSSDFASAQLGSPDMGCALKTAPKQWHDIAAVGGGRLASGASRTGHVCFVVDPLDVASLDLRVMDASCPSTPLKIGSCNKYVVFKLR